MQYNKKAVEFAVTVVDDSNRKKPEFETSSYKTEKQQNMSTQSAQKVHAQDTEMKAKAYLIPRQLNCRRFNKKKR